MNTTGKIVIRKEKTKVLKSGKLAVYNKNGYCNECCQCCKPQMIATFIVPQNENTDRTWDLAPFQNEGIVTENCPGQYWRLRNNYMSYVPERKGCVDENGQLTGLPDSISPTSYKYTWVFTLELGCRYRKNPNKIEWADGSKTDIFEC
jgi:hypothetical protein